MTESIQKKIEKNPEVVEKATRRRFTAEYKQSIATEAEQCGDDWSMYRVEGFAPGRQDLLNANKSCFQEPRLHCRTAHFLRRGNWRSKPSNTGSDRNHPLVVWGYGIQIKGHQLIERW